MNINLQNKLEDICNYLNRGENLLAIMYDNYLAMNEPPKTFEFNYNEIQTLTESAIFFLFESKKMLDDILK